MNRTELNCLPRHSIAFSVSVCRPTSVCLSVCLFARISEKPQCPCCLWPGSVLFWRQCDKLCTSGLVDDVMFSNDGTSGPKSGTMLCFVSLPDGSTGGEVSAYDYRLALNMLILWTASYFSSYIHFWRRLLVHLNNIRPRL